MGRAKKHTPAARTLGALERANTVLKGFFFGRPLDEATTDRLREVKGLLLAAFALFVLVSMASYYAPFDDPAARKWNWGGQAGFYFANGAHLALGLAGYLAFGLCVAWGAVMVGGRGVSWVGLRFFGGVLFVLSTAFLLQHLFGPVVESGADLAAASGTFSARLPYGPGGWLALRTTPFLVEKFGNGGLVILLPVLALVSFLLATEMAFYPAVQGLLGWLRERNEVRGEGALAAVGGYARSIAGGLWSFLRGADLPAGLAPAGGGSAATAWVEPTTRSRKPLTKRIIEASEEEDEEQAEELPAPAEEEDALVPRAALDDADEDAEEEDLDEDGEAFEAGLADEDEEEDGDEDDEDDLDAGLDEDEDASDVEVQPIAASGKKSPVAQRVQPKLAFDPPTPPPGPWTFPPLELLIPPSGDVGVDEKFLEASAEKLENALRSFRVEATVVGAQVGPAVTLFELTVAQGTRMNKVTQLSQEIAAALRAQSVRIIAPIPGRETIGIEVPNAKRRVVRISELVVQKAYDPKVMSLPLFLGMDAEGTPIIEDLAKMPHLLIAGTTGSGKSVCINTILASLLLTRSPHDVKMILVDPKMVELQMFANVPHLMCPVVTDARQATGVLLWVVEKMEGRYELFKNAGVKNIKGYNALAEEELQARLGEEWDDERTPRHVPYIVVVVDEMADLMMTSKKEAELAITRLAQKSRAVGIHVIVATQRPSTDVITGVIKGNLPTRIAFQVASKIDSRVILDDSGADKLLGNGDMLYMGPGGAKLKRVQGALVEDSELTALVGFVCSDSAPNFSQELIQVATGTAVPGGEMSGSGPDEDPMFDDAVRVILKSKRGSASLLQRALGVGYTRASRLIDIMTEQGIVGPHKGSKSRELMMTLEDWEEMHGASKSHAGGHGAGEGAGDE